MRLFRLLDDSGACAEGFMASDGRCVTLSTRVLTLPTPYKSEAQMRDDWRSARFEWVGEAVVS